MITGWIVLAVLAQKATETPSRSRDDVVVVHDTYSACMITPVDRSLEWIPAGGEYRCGGRTISRSSIDELRRLALGSRKDPPDVVETLGLSPQLVERHRSEIRREFEGFEGVLDSNHHPVPLPDYLEPLLEYNEIARWILDCLHREEPWSTTRAHVDVELPGDS